MYLGICFKAPLSEKRCVGLQTILDIEQKEQKMEIATLGIAYFLAGLTIRFTNTGQLSFVLSILLLEPR